MIPGLLWYLVKALKGGPEGPKIIKMGQQMISEGLPSAKVVLVGAPGTNCGPEGPRFFPFITMEKNLFYSLWAPMGPPVAVGPGKKFRLSHPLSGPESAK